jgi:hypothetical protein
VSERRRRRADSTRCRVTNTGSEKGPEDLRLRNNPRFMRDGRPLAETVNLSVVDAAGDAGISTRDMEYWFRSDDADLEEEEIWLDKAEEIPSEVFSVRADGWRTVRRPRWCTQPGVVAHCVHCTQLGAAARC